MTHKITHIHKKARWYSKTNVSMHIFCDIARTHFTVVTKTADKPPKKTSKAYIHTAMVKAVYTAWWMPSQVKHWLIAQAACQSVPVRGQKTSNLRGRLVIPSKCARKLYIINLESLLDHSRDGRRRSNVLQWGLGRFLPKCTLWSTDAI